ncbi:MAG TPA: peptidase domain-containing ABC transporter [Flavitalea sp.]|nr:peptidase domain-containing ABC transporter [Flavitalea sp.]
MKKIVLVKQRDISDCGSACLASVAGHYKLRLPVSKIRQYAGTDKRGTNITGLIEAAEKIGLQARGAKGGPDSLDKIPLPSIVHLILQNQHHHYVVVYKVTDRYICYMDPAEGKVVKKIRSAFLAEWSGVIVLLLPGESFQKGKYTHSNLSRFWQLIKPHKLMMLQALVGALVFTVLGLASSIYVQKIVDNVLVDDNLRLLNLLSVVMIVLLVFQIVIGGLKSVLALQTGQHMDTRLILGYYKHLLDLPQRFFDTMRVGEIISRVNDAVKIRIFVNEIALNIIVNILIIALSVALMFLYYWKLALIMLMIVPIYVMIYLLSNYTSKKQQRVLMENSAELETQFVESLNAAGTIKRFGVEEFANAKTESSFSKLLVSVYRAGISSLYIGSFSELTTRLFTIILLWAGSFFVIRRELSPGELLSFYALIGYLTAPAVSLIGANRNIQDALIAADRLYEIIDLETEKPDTSQVELTAENLGDICFEGVAFRYGTRTEVFNDLSLRITARISTAIVGESGSGKSTLAALLQNLYPLKNGYITIGGLNIKHISNRSLRHVIGVVPQEIDLFAGSIVENIALGDPEPDMQSVLNLCHLLGLRQFIESLPQHYHTILSEQAVNLSGGQRQRIAIARALYRKPEILILDEATSSLDPASEKAVLDTLEWFQNQGKTLIIIAHRLSTIKNCQQILVLQNGRLTESGNHAQLLEAGGCYASLWNYHVNKV